MQPANALNTLSALRLAVGAGSWFTPRLAGRLFGIDAKANPQSPYLARLFGARDLALAVGAKQSTGEARRLWLQAGLACDLADAVAGAAAGGKGYLPRHAAVMATVTAVAAAALGAAVLAGDL